MNPSLTEIDEWIGEELDRLCVQDNDHVSLGATTRARNREHRRKMLNAIRRIVRNADADTRTTDRS